MWDRGRRERDRRRRSGMWVRPVWNFGERPMERVRWDREVKEGRRRGYHVSGRVELWRWRVWRLGRGWGIGFRDGGEGMSRGRA